MYSGNKYTICIFYTLYINRTILHNIIHSYKIGLKGLSVVNEEELVKVCKLPFSTGKSTNYKANNCLLFKLQDGKISLNNATLKTLKFELKMPIQFFIENGDTIIIRKHQFVFSYSEGMSFTSQSGIINKNKYLNIPKKLRDKLDIKDGDTLKAKILENTLIINKFNSVS